MKKRAAFRHGRRWAKPVDQMMMGQAVRQPGIDPRTWVSIGIVTAGGEGDEIVVFDEDEGQAFVRVLLQPQKTPIYARVGSQVAGDGEADWNPFVEGDELVVVLPEGDERAGGIIICRLNNSIDKFPMGSVAGQDPTTNSFAFTRRRTAVVQEMNGPILWRSSTSDALFGLDPAGIFTVKTGDKSVFQMSPDAIGFQGPSSDDTPADMMLQMNITGRQFSLTIGDALLNISASDAEPEPLNVLNVPNAMKLQTAGNSALEHPMTIENFVNIMLTLLPLVNPLVITAPPIADGMLATAIGVGTTSGPWAAAMGAQSAITAALNGQPQKMAALPNGLSAQPGVCTTGLTIG